MTLEEKQEENNTLTRETYHALIGNKFTRGLIPEFREHVEEDRAQALKIEEGFLALQKQITDLNTVEANKKYFKSETKKIIGIVLGISAVIISIIELILHSN